MLTFGTWFDFDRIIRISCQLSWFLGCGSKLADIINKQGLHSIWIIYFYSIHEQTHCSRSPGRYFIIDVINLFKINRRGCFVGDNPR